MKVEIKFKFILEERRGSENWMKNRFLIWENEKEKKKFNPDKFIY